MFWSIIDKNHSDLQLCILLEFIEKHSLNLVLNHDSAWGKELIEKPFCSLLYIVINKSNIPVNYSRKHYLNYSTFLLYVSLSQLLLGQSVKCKESIYISILDLRSILNKTLY